MSSAIAGLTPRIACRAPSISAFRGCFSLAMNASTSPTDSAAGLLCGFFTQSAFQQETPARSTGAKDRYSACRPELDARDELVGHANLQIGQRSGDFAAHLDVFNEQ